MTTSNFAGENTTIHSADGDFHAYMAKPSTNVSNGSSVVVLQEIFGVTRRIRSYCDLLAQEGYLAIAPDLFWRQSPGVELSRTAEGVKEAIGFLAGFNDASAMKDIEATAAFVAPMTRKKIAALGFCLGGKLAAMAAASNTVDTGISFYGVGLEEHLTELKNSSRPIQFHFGGADEHVPMDIVDLVRLTVKSKANCEFHVYEEAGHAFVRPDLADATSQEAWRNALHFLTRH